MSHDQWYHRLEWQHLNPCNKLVPVHETFLDLKDTKLFNSLNNQDVLGVQPAVSQIARVTRWPSKFNFFVRNEAWVVNEMSRTQCYVINIKFITWIVEKCFSLNLSSTYLRTSDVLPTQPSPSNTILKLSWLRTAPWFLDIFNSYFRQPCKIIKVQ